MSACISLVVSSSWSSHISLIAPFQGFATSKEWLKWQSLLQWRSNADAVRLFRSLLVDYVEFLNLLWLFSKGKTKGFNEFVASYSRIIESNTLLMFIGAYVLPWQSVHISFATYIAIACSKQVLIIFFLWQTKSEMNFLHFHKT